MSLVVQMGRSALAKLGSPTVARVVVGWVAGRSILNLPVLVKVLTRVVALFLADLHVAGEVDVHDVGELERLEERDGQESVVSVVLRTGRLRVHERAYELLLDYAAVVVGELNRDGAGFVEVGAGGGVAVFDVHVELASRVVGVDQD